MPQDEWQLPSLPTTENLRLNPRASHTLIGELATAFRSAIERMHPIKLPGGLGIFPKGNCLSASLLLGAYLADNGVMGFRSIWGERFLTEGRCVTHVWLENESRSLIVDITADQFGSSQPRVLVTKHSDWHQTFEITAIEESDFRNPAMRGLLPFPQVELLYEKLVSALHNPE